MLGTRTWGGRMEGADESTVLWRHQLSVTYLHYEHFAVLTLRIYLKSRQLMYITFKFPVVSKNLNSHQ